MLNSHSLWTDRSPLSVTRSNHVVVLINCVIPFLEIGIRQEPQILLGSNPARLVHCIDQCGVKGHPVLFPEPNRV